MREKLKDVWTDVLLAMVCFIAFVGVLLAIVIDICESYDAKPGENQTICEQGRTE